MAGRGIGLRLNHILMNSQGLARDRPKRTDAITSIRESLSAEVEADRQLTRTDTTTIIIVNIIPIVLVESLAKTEMTIENETIATLTIPGREEVGRATDTSIRRINTDEDSQCQMVLSELHFIFILKIH